VLQGGLLGIVGCFPHRYITAVVGGQALGGVFAALANIISLVIGASPASSALAYFLIADIELALALAAYLALSSSVRINFLHYSINLLIN
jgi:equilibrative nucleoside transporter 1/2/3